MTISFHYAFIDGERFLKVGQHFAKLWARVCYPVFLAQMIHSVASALALVRMSPVAKLMIFHQMPSPHADLLIYAIRSFVFAVITFPLKTSESV